MRISSTLVRVAVIALLTLALGLAPAIPAQASSGGTSGWFDALVIWVANLGAQTTPDG
jgi:hypothetical protein